MVQARLIYLVVGNDTILNQKKLRTYALKETTDTKVNKC